MRTDPILSTLGKLISLHEGIAELTSEQSLSVLLTENIAKALHLPDEVTLSTRADIPNSFFVTYHSELLNKFSSLLAERGLVTALEVKFNGYLKTTGFEKLVQQLLIPQNGLIRLVDAIPEITRYIWCHVAYIAEADEKRIGMVSFIINSLTGVTPVEIGDALFWESDRIPVDNQQQPPMMSIDELSSLIEKTSEKLINAELENWHGKLRRAIARDSERLHTYFGAISSEINSKISSRRLIGEDKDKELARLSATNRELERKLSDLQARYALTVEASLHSAMVIHLPCVQIQCELKRKKAKRIVTTVWNPFTKTIEPLRCELSGEPVKDFYLDDKEAKIISPKVWAEQFVE